MWEKRLSRQQAAGGVGSPTSHNVGPHHQPNNQPNPQQVEKILPQHPPEGSLWRRVKILVPEDGVGPAAAAAGEGSLSSSGSLSLAGARSATGAGGRTARVGSTSSGGGGEGEGRGAGGSGSSSGGSRRASTSVGGGGGEGRAAEGAAAYREVKYWWVVGLSDCKGGGWGFVVSPGLSTITHTSTYICQPTHSTTPRRYEVQRSHWHNRLGNLVLLQPSAQASRLVAGGAAHLNSDIDAKLAYYAACGADEAFPEFTGGLVTGKYCRDKFSPEEARSRHADVVQRLAAVLGLCQSDWS